MDSFLFVFPFSCFSFCGRQLSSVSVIRVREAKSSRQSDGAESEGAIGPKRGARADGRESGQPGGWAGRDGAETL